VAARAGVAMTLLQLGIGTTNDVVDAPFDAGHKPGKPIPAGVVEPRLARLAAVGLFASGAVVAATIDLRLVALSGLVIAIGLLYDLRLKGTAWSWLPFAVGIPILPVFGWLAARGSLTPAFAILLPAAVAGGAALAIANGLVDVERDRASGRTSIAATLGRQRATALQIVLLVAITLAAGATIPVFAGSSIVAWIAPAAGAGAVVAAWIARARPDLAERAWQAEAMLLAIAAVTWALVVLR
jgi:4-hydroxybenzoate polyprenyltransferase